MKYRIIYTIPGQPSSTEILTNSPMFEFSRLLNKLMRHYEDITIRQYIDRAGITIILLHCGNDICTFIVGEMRHDQNH